MPPQVGEDGKVVSPPPVRSPGAAEAGRLLSPDDGRGGWSSWSSSGSSDDEDDDFSEYVDSDEEDSEDDDDGDDGTTWEDLEREAAASDRLKRSKFLLPLSLSPIMYHIVWHTVTNVRSICPLIIYYVAGRDDDYDHRHYGGKRRKR